MEIGFDRGAGVVFRREQSRPGDTASSAPYDAVCKAGLEKLEVRWAILEPDGKISIVPTGDTGTMRGTDDDQPL